MGSLARWLVAIVSTLATFGVCLWLFRFISFSWMPHATADRWAVAAAFATVAATAVGAATAWWANREGESSEGPVFGPRGDYRGAIFNIESKRGTPSEPPPEQTPESEDIPEGSDAPSSLGTGAAIIRFPRRKARRLVPAKKARSWDDLAEILQNTSLDSADWVALAGSTAHLRNELAAQRIPDPNVPDSVPRLVARLQELLSTVSSPAPPESLGPSLAEARELRELLLRYLSLLKG